MSLETTSSQTIGPYLHIGLNWLVTDGPAGPTTGGERVTIEGHVTDGDGQAVDDAVIEIWQANAHGRYAHPEDTRELPLEREFTGFGRVMTGDNGAFRFATIKPGRVPGIRQPWQAPHLNITLFTRGLLKHLVTRMYFPDAAANAQDEALSRVPPERRGTLIAQRVAGKGEFVWNIVLQGRDETVFFDY